MKLSVRVTPGEPPVFRRAGFEFTREPVVIDATEEQAESIMSDPTLIATRATDKNTKK